METKWNSSSSSHYLKQDYRIIHMRNLCKESDYLYHTMHGRKLSQDLKKCEQLSSALKSTFPSLSNLLMPESRLFDQEGLEPEMH